MMSSIREPFSMAIYNLIFVGIFLAAAFLPTNALAQNDHSWYVSNNGSDNNNGWTPQTPRRTLGGIVDSLGPGDILYIMGGHWHEYNPNSHQYWNRASLNVEDMHGTASNPIVIRNYPGTFPVIYGDGTAADGVRRIRAVMMYRSSHIVIDSLRMTQSLHMGIGMVDCDTITIQNCQIDSNYIENGGDNGGGIHINGGLDESDACYGLNIYNNLIFHNHLDISGTGQTNADGIHGYGIKHSIIRRNTIWGQTSAGAIRFKNFGNDGNLIDSNIIHTGYSGWEVATASDSNIFRYNVIYNISRPIYFYTYGSTSSNYNKIYNNTIYGNGLSQKRGASFGLGNDWGTVTNAPSQHTSFFNNIISNVSMGSVGGPVVFLDRGQTFDIWDYNLWYGTSGSQTDLVNWNQNYYTLSEHISAHDMDDNSLWSAPDFLSTNPSSADFLKISSTSPAATSGRGGEWPSYMGAFNPFSEANISVSPGSLGFSAQPNGTPPESKSFTLQNTGAGVLEWSISDNAGWLSVDPVSGSSNSQVISVYINDTSLPVGEYDAVITITSSSAGNSPQTVSVSYKIDNNPPAGIGDLDGY